MPGRTDWKRVTRPPLALAAWAIAGCTDNASSFFIRQMNAPVVAGVVCNLPFDPNSPRVNEGTLDVGLREDYLVSPLFQSQMVSNASPQSGRIDTAGILVDGFVIELRDGSPTGELLERPFSVYQTTYVPPAMGGTPTFAVTQLQVIPPLIGQRLRSQVCVVDRAGVSENCPVPRIRQRVKRVIVRMYAFGRTQGNVQVETPVYDFPVNVCCGCLVQFPADSDQPDMVRPGPDCAAGVALPGPGQCFPGSDFPLDCRFCAAANPEFCQPRGFRALTTMGAGGMIMSSPCPLDR